MQFAIISTAKLLPEFESGGLGSLTVAGDIDTAPLVMDTIVYFTHSVLLARGTMRHAFNYSFSMQY